MPSTLNEKSEPHSRPLRRLWRHLQGIGLAGICLVGCHSTTAPVATPPAQTPPLPSLHFTDATRQAKIGFRHENGAFGLKMIPETMGGGAIFFDYNNDGWPDLLLVNSRQWTKDEVEEFRTRPWAPAETAFFHFTHPQGGKPRRNMPPLPPRRQAISALYKNNRDGTFSDVTRGSGLDFAFYGMGGAAADYDGDGWTDLYLTGWPRNYLLRNRGNGRFENVTAQAGVADKGWSTSAAWFDYDKDGRPDLFVGHYVQWSPRQDVFGSGDNKNKGYTRPDVYNGEPSRLFRNVDGRRFADVSHKSGVTKAGAGELIEGTTELIDAGKALGVAVFDWNNDSWPDIFVANDMTPNHLLENTGRGTFKNIASQTGIAVGAQGRARAGMGVDTADFDHSGSEDLLIGNFTQEMLGLYRNDGAHFTDVAPASRVGQQSYDFLTFGLAFADFNNDSWPDFITANGHVADDIAAVVPDARYRQRPQLFINRNGNFEEIGTASGAALQQDIVGRGLACADYDLDGDIDVVLTNNGGAPLLLRNDTEPQNNALRLVLRLKNNDALGAVAEVTANGVTQRKTVRSGSSYLSQSEFALHFGLGNATKIDSLRVRFPSGQTLALPAQNANQILVISEQGLQSSKPFAATNQQ